ncbi:hypothetical protein QTP70_008921 [Hemibagrus guttatus]|uniref:ribonuclease H n=1 Tax=Hemibagrus guttatus TaxID=175788 RepID=A0AAE0QDT5_9TELE|nr:hypothetical protein QTP70_008921 [Hemibagrus guttatus]
MVVCRMTLMVCKKKRSEIEKKTKWWKLKKEECCEEFRQKLRQALGGQVVLPDDWETTAEVIRETGRKVLGVSSGRRKEDKETWWWNEEVQDSIQRKRLAKKKWDMDRTEENRQEYKELQRRVKREVSKAKQKAYEELYTRLDTREGEKDLYRLARQRDRDGKDVQQVRVIKDRDGRVLTSEESVQRRWKEYFEELMNEENERENRVEGVNSVEQKVDKIRKDEVRKALKRMKSGKAVGPDDIPVEVWKCLGEAAVEFLASLFNRVLESERMPEEWRRSVLVPIFKNKGDVQSCSNYRGIKLMSHTMKVWERVVEARLRKVVEICEQQYGFMPRKSTTDAIFALRILMEKYRDGQRELHCVFVDLEKAYDRVPREELWYCMRKSGVAEKYVRVVQDMYERSRTVVRCAVGQTEEFNVEVGLHQGSALSPFLFAIVMDQLSEEVRQESPWTMMFADDIVICSESREQVEENLERWRFALERRGMKVSRSKTEYMCVNEREGSGTVRLQGEEVKKVQEFKYLGSTVQSNGECGKEVKKRVQAGWNGWRKVSGVLCDQKISARIKGKVYRTVVRPAMLYGLETVSLRKRQESELEVAELKMLRFSLGVTRLDRIRNEYIRGTAHVGRLGDKVREARLRWFGHVQRRENADVELLIGMNVPRVLEPLEVIRSVDKGPYAIKTMLGWTVNGPLGGGCCDGPDVYQSAGTINRISAVTLDELWKQQFKTDFPECSQEEQPGLSREDCRFLEMVNNTVKLVDGHYSIALPLKDRKISMPNNHNIAEQRTLNLKRRFLRDPLFHKDYTAFMDNLLSNGYAERVPTTDLARSDGKVWYLPHHGVYHPKKRNIRVVFDCAASFQGASLNAQLLSGPDLTSTLIGVLTRFRKVSVVLMSDVEAMFHQVRVPEEDVDLLRFLWWSSGDFTQCMEEYRMVVHLFGATSSPSCANFALRRCAEDNKDFFTQQVFETIVYSFYVDDCLASVTSEQEAISLYKDLKNICAKGGFHLTKWICNSRGVLASIPEEERAKEVKDLDLDHDSLPVERALGVRCVQSDTF